MKMILKKSGIREILYPLSIISGLILITSCATKDQNIAEQKSILQIDPAYELIIDSILDDMTLNEKVALLHGTGKFVSGGNERFNLPEFWYTDGPNGVREELERHSWQSMNLTDDSATFFPTGTALAATWNPDMAFLYGTTIGSETRARNKDMLLGPAINIIRTPLCGRNFEYFSEDPFLNSRIAVGYVQGLQSMDVAACVKHFTANNQEFERSIIDVDMSERALREIYLPAYKATVKEANALGMMGAYNKFRGEYLCENNYLNNKILKGEFGFQGIVVSDWGATHNTVTAALGGLDVEMGTREDHYDSCYFGHPLRDAVLNGTVPEEVVNDKVRRVLRVYYNLGMTKEGRKQGELTTSRISSEAYKIASEAIVLLKNDANLLPLQEASLKSVAVIGANAKQIQATGGYTAGVKAKYEITPYDGLKNRLGEDVQLNYAAGYNVQYEESPRYPINTPEAELIAEAVELAKQSEVAIVFAGNTRQIETEGTDRRDIKLPFGQDELIKAVIEANPRTIVVVIAGSICELTDVKKAAPAILYSWFNGSEGGNALADVLLGKINPSGKLPFTIPVKLEDVGAHAMNAYPGENHKIFYKEGILVGYRWFDTKNIEPLYPFGYGLSYTTFAYSDVKTNKKEFGLSDTVEVEVAIRNTGNIAGKEIVQGYVHVPVSNVFRAEKELKGFTKIELQPGEEEPVKLKIKVSDLAYFDESSNSWQVETGEYKILIGSSSGDIKEEIYIQVVQ